MDKSSYLDENGYPGTRQWDGSWDGGDTAAIMGTVRTLVPTSSLIEFTMDYPWNQEYDQPIRHPDTTKWYSQPWNFSRDQLVPVLCSLILGPAREAELSRLLAAHKKRLFLSSWNGDLTTLEVWALWLRILRPWWAKLVLPVLDLETLVNTFLWRWVRKDNVARNQMLVCLMIQKHSPTWVGWLAYKLLPWEDLLTRWENHCKAVGEYPTYDLFRNAYEESKRG